MSTTTEPLTIETAKAVDLSADPRRVWVYEGRNHAVSCTEIGMVGMEHRWVIEVARYNAFSVFDSAFNEIGELNNSAARVVIEHYLNAN